MPQRPCASIVACLPAHVIDGYLFDSLTTHMTPALGMLLHVCLTHAIILPSCTVSKGVLGGDIVDGT